MNDDIVTDIFDEEELPPVPDDPHGTSNPMALARDWGLDIEQQSKLLEKAVKYGPQMIRFRNTLIRMFSYSQDWTCFGEGEAAKACLSAAGVLRIVDKANFPIRYHNINCKKQNLLDDSGTVCGYRYIYEGYATLGSRTVHAVGQYSTREAFLGKRGGEWRDWHEINESHIRQAAHTYFKGNAAKDLLGLKNIPWSEYESLTTDAGQDADKSVQVKHGKGTQGGVDPKDRDAQNGLKQELMALAEIGMVVRLERDKEGGIEQVLDEPSNELLDYIQKNNTDTRETYCKASLKALTTWKNSRNKIIEGHADFEKIKHKQAFVLSKKLAELREKEGV